MLTFIWIIVWLVHAHPWLMGSWNPWNIALIVCAALDVCGTRACTS
jgi:hypothetical protein